MQAKFIVLNQGEKKQTQCTSITKAEIKGDDQKQKGKS